MASSSARGGSGWTGGRIPSWKEFKVPSHPDHSRILLSPLGALCQAGDGAAQVQSSPAQVLTWAPPAPPNPTPGSPQSSFSCSWAPSAPGSILPWGLPLPQALLEGLQHSERELSVYLDLQKGI